jgi:general secretion pathway protein L
MTTLIVTLPLSAPETGTEYDYVLTPDGKTITRVGRVAASLLPALPKAGDEVAAVVPARALSWHRVELPKGVIDKGLLNRTGQPARLRAVLEGLLEEQLLDDPASLHFALAPQARDGEAVWVAVCDRSWLRAALHALELARHPVSRIVPEFAPETDAPQQTSTLFVTQGLESPQLVAPGAQGVAVLPLGAAAVSLLAWPESSPVVAEPAVSALAEQLFKRQVSLLPEAQRWLRSAQSAWNLAQFDFASSSRTRHLRKLSQAWVSFARAPQWRAARWATWLLLASQVIGLNAWAWREKAALEGKRTAIRNTLLSTFPDVPVVLDAPLQMEREVNALRQTTGAVSGRDLEAILGAVSLAVPAGQALTAIDFVSGEARLKGMQLNPAQADSLVTQLKAHGYTARFEGEQLFVQQESSQ